MHVVIAEATPYAPWQQLIVQSVQKMPAVDSWQEVHSGGMLTVAACLQSALMAVLRSVIDPNRAVTAPAWTLPILIAGAH
jgi:hypothetical protein